MPSLSEQRHITLSRESERAFKFSNENEKRRNGSVEGVLSLRQIFTHYA